LKLHWSPRSPFVRKVMIALHETGLVDRVELVRTNVALAAPTPSVLLPDNPLGKIPTLVLDDGSTLFDSRVICEYLDTLHSGPKLLPADPARRLAHLRLTALGDGITDILLMWRNERLRPDGAQSAPIMASYETKIRTSFAQLERDISAIAAMPFGIGHVALVCALGQMDFRFGDTRWREVHPKLVAWYDAVRKRPSVQATEVHDDAPPVPIRELSGPAFTFV
jgi:glutathione S-transferase